MNNLYGKRSVEQGPSTYTDAQFIGRIIDATGIEAFSGSAVVLDYMSGEGQLASEMQKRAIRHHYVVVEPFQEELDKITSPSLEKVQGSLEELPLEDNSVDFAVIRYRVKNVPREKQLAALKEVHRVLRPGGVLVVADMETPEGTGDWLTEHHRLKQRLSLGGNPPAGGECYIPTEAEWLRMFSQAGFDAETFDYHVSRVKTAKWVRGNQITDEQRLIMDENILSAPEELKIILKIRKEDDGVHIDYPVVIFQAISSRSVAGNKIGTDAIINSAQDIAGGYSGL